MNIQQALQALEQYRCLIGKNFRQTPIADVLIVPVGVGIGYLTAIEELSEQEENYDTLLKDFKDFQLMVTFAHPFLPAMPIETLDCAA